MKKMKRAGRFEKRFALGLRWGRKNMGFVDLFLLAVGLSMDAFAVSVCKGLVMKKEEWKKGMICCGMWFGGFQALMPLIGYLSGLKFEKYVEKYASWIAFGLLVIIGVNMIRETFSDADEKTSALFDYKTMFFMAAATSIDAFAVGITFVCVPVSVVPAGTLANTLTGAMIIGIVTFVLSCIGVKTGNIFGTKCKGKAEVIGGTILILIGVKILLES